MRKCAVLGCPNSKCYFPDKTFFKFPLKNEKLLQVWLKNIGRRSFKPSTSSIVCSDHFPESSYDVCPFTKRKKLKQGSFPINFNQPPKPRPHCVLLSTATNGSYPQLDESKRFIPGAVPSVPPYSLASTSSQPPNTSENPQDQGKIRIPRLLPPQEQQCVQISIIQPPIEQVQPQNPNCMPVLLNNSMFTGGINNSMFILPVNVNQAPKAHSTYENRRCRKRRLQTAVAPIRCRLAPKPDINAEKRESQAGSGTESQNVAETSVAINQEPVVAINQEPVVAINQEPVVAINQEPVVAINQGPVIAINQEPDKSADKPPVLVIRKTASSSSIKLLPSTSSSFISSSPSSSSPSYGSALVPGRALPLTNPNSTNVAEMSIDIKQEPAETAAAPLPDFAHSSPINIVEMSIDIKQEPVESAAAPLPDFLPDMLTSACSNSSNVAEMSIEIKEEPIESAAAPIPDMLRSPNSTNVAEAPIVIKQEPIESAAAPISGCVIPDFAHSSSTNAAADTSYAIKRESVDESPQLVSKKIHLAEEMTSSTKNFSPAISSSYSISSSTSSSSPSMSPSYSISPSTSSSSSSCSSAAPSPQNVLPFDSNSDTTSADEIPSEHIPNKPTKKKIIFLKTPKPGAAQAKQVMCAKSSTPPKPAATSKKSAEGTARTSQADLCWRTLMSMASKKNSEVPSPKKSGGQSSELANKSGENVSREMLQSLLGVSESNPSFGSRSAERTGDLFDVFADFVAEKLRRMDLDDCAYALKAIVDIVSEPGEVQGDNSSL